jgi:hypothetical protein
MTDKDKKEVKPQYYDVRLEITVPATMHFRIYADSAEEAAKKAERHSVDSIKYHLPKRKNISMVVYKAGTSMLEFAKRFF